MNDTVTLRYKCPTCDLELDIPRTPDKLDTVVQCLGLLKMNVTTGEFDHQGHDPVGMMIIGVVGETNE